MTLPAITIGKADRQRLISLAKDALSQPRPMPAASILLGEVARAKIVSNKFLPTDVVAMHRQIEIRDNVTNGTKRLRLVDPDEHISGAQAVSVVTPIGAALIGLSEGDTIEWCSPAGDRHNVTVLRVWPGAPGSHVHTVAAADRSPARSSDAGLTR